MRRRYSYSELYVEFSADLLRELLLMMMSSALMISMDFLQELKATTSTLLEFLTNLFHELDLESTTLKLKNRKGRLNLARRGFISPVSEAAAAWLPHLASSDTILELCTAV
nr:hypothetical protein Iba_chr06cCG9920 [Ipomoea batatas]